MWSALKALLTQALLVLLGQPVPGPSRAERRQAERKRQAVREVRGASRLAGMWTVVREALYALIAQPSPPPRSASARSDSSRRRPRS